MARTLDMILDELQTHRAALEGPQEGAKDFESVNLTPPAHLVASEGRGRFVAQRALTVAAIDVVLALSDACGDNARLRALVMAAIEAFQALAGESTNSPKLRALVIAVVEALQALTDNSDYPELPSLEAEDPVLSDLDAQIESMQAFRAQVRKKNPPAVAVRVTVGEPQKKNP